ncbi:MAG: hypothetical protein QM487_13490 [Candidatus Marithrix sp.]
MQNKKLAIAIQSAIFTLAVGSVIAEPLTYSDMSSSMSVGISDSTISTRKGDDDDKSGKKDDDDGKSGKKDDDDGKSGKKDDDDGKSGKKDDDGKSGKKDDDDGKSGKQDDDDDKSDNGIKINIEVIYELGNPITDELATPDTLDDDTIVIIDFTELSVVSIAELSLEIIASLTSENFATIPLDALIGLTLEQISALDISIWKDLTAEQLSQLASSLTAEYFVELSQEILDIAGFNLLMAFESNTVEEVLLTIEESTAWNWMSNDDNTLGWVVLNYVDTIDTNLDKFIPTGWNIVEEIDELKFDIDIAMIPNLSIDLISSLTADNLSLLDVNVVNYFTVEQAEIIPPTTWATADTSYLTLLTESGKGLSNDFFTKVIVNFNVADLETKYQKKYEKDYAKELEKLYKLTLPKGWKVDVKIKDGKTSVKLKPPKQVLQTSIFLKNLNPKFVTAIEFEDDNDYNDLITSLFDYSEVISDDLIIFAETQPIANRINISFNLINQGNIGRIDQVIPSGWTFNSRTNYINMTSDAVAQLTPDVMVNISSEQIVRFEPQVFSHFTVKQITNFPTLTVKKMNRRQMANLSVKSFAGFTKQHFASFSSEAVSGMTVEHFNVVSQEALSGLTMDNVGGLDSEVIYAMGADILNNIGSTTRLSVADSIKIFSNLNINLVQPTEIAKFLHQDIQIDITTKKLKLKKGKLKLPKAKKVVLPMLVMPDLPDLNVSLNFGGAFTEQTILTDLTKVLALPKINFPDFSFQQSDTGIVKIKGSGASQGIELAFRAAVIEQLEVGVDPGLGVDEEGNYALTTAEGQQVTFAPMPKDPEMLAEVIPDGTIEIAETGEVNIDLDSEDETADKLAGVFDPEVKQADLGLKIGINIEGTGVDQIAKIVYNDGTMQTVLPAVQDRASVDIAGPIAAGVSNLKFTYNTSGQVFYNLDGFKWRARPELKVTKVKVNINKPVIKVLQVGKLVELTTVNGFRQLIHIEKTD